MQKQKKKEKKQETDRQKTDSIVKSAKLGNHA